MRTHATNIAIAMVALVLGFGVQQYAYGEDNATSPVPPDQQVVFQVPAISTGFHTLLNQGTAIDWATGGIRLSPGFTTIDTFTGFCSRSSGCTFGFESMVQAGNQTRANNRWAICGVVDGTFVNPECPFQGTLPTNRLYQTKNYRGNWQVGPGHHTLSTVVYVDFTATLGEWEADYRVYGP
jgi:hypothetical protein